MDFKSEFNTQVAEEEDGYYAEIRKHIILMLTAYDDDEVKQLPKAGIPSSITAAKQGAECQLSDHHPQTQRNLSWCPNGNGVEGHGRHVNPWENGNGTGVFIPQAVKYKRYCILRRMRKHERKEKHRRKDNKIQDNPCFKSCIFETSK